MKSITHLIFYLLCLHAHANPQHQVLHYTFDDGTAADMSGSGNEGTVHDGEFLESPKGRALRLDGTAVFIECPTSDSLRSLEREGSLEMWIKPDALQGGLVNWSSGVELKDQRLVMVFDTRGGPNAELTLTTSDGTGLNKHARNYGLNLPAVDAWNHVALTFDGNTISYYLDGRLSRIHAQQRGRADLADLPMWIGRCRGHGEEFFKGEMDEIRIYDRAISSENVLVHFKESAGSFGKDTSVFDVPVLKAHLLPEPGWITAEIDVGLMRPLPKGSSIVAHIMDARDERALGSTVQALPTSATIANVKLHAENLRAGTYRVRAGVADPRGEPIGESVETEVSWPGRDPAFRNIKVLNNLVWEFLDETPGTVKGKREYVFHSPKTRWILFEATAEAKKGKLTISVAPPGDRPAEIVFNKGESGSREAMCFLPAGDARLIVQAAGRCRLSHLSARSIPEIFHHKLLAGPKPIGHSPDTVEFMKDHVLGNINTFVGPLYHPLVQEHAPTSYRRLKSVHAKGTPDIGEPLFTSAEEAYTYITTSKGFASEYADGIIFDEITHPSVQCRYYADAIRTIIMEEQYKGKLIYAYIATLYNHEDGRDFVQAILEAGGSLVWERYLATRKSEDAAREYLRQIMAVEAAKYRELCPGSIERLNVLFGYFSLAGGHLNNASPSVDYKTFLDMQFNLVANDPAFWGTYGLGGYGSSYADEETTRWFLALHRHYGLEGNTDPLTGDPYRPGHIENGDFLYGAEGWELNPAEEGSIRADFRRGWGHLQARKARMEGDGFLVTRRSAETPNTFSQDIRSLEPGRLYVFRMYTGDYAGMTRNETHAVRIRIEGATNVPEKSYMYQVCNPPWGSFPPYNRNNLAWMNYHYRVFRADGETAKLVISDWGSDAAPALRDVVGDDVPGGPIGQEIMYNFIGVVPYFSDQ